MSLGTSFSTSGATPQQPTPSYGGLFGGGTNPVSKALGAMSAPQTAPPAPKANIFSSIGDLFKAPPANAPSLTGTPQAGSYGGLLNSSPTVAPSTPLKSHTITDTAGNTTTQTFHAPVTDTTATTKADTGPVVPSQSTMSTTPPVPTPSAGAIQSQLTDAQNQLKTATAMGYGANDQIQKDANGNVIQNPASQTAPTSTYGGLINKGVNALNQEALATNAIANDPNFSIETQLGKEGQAQQSLAGQADAAFQGANTAAPVSQFGVLTDPTTGKAISPDGGLAAATQGGTIQGAQDAARSNTSIGGTAAVDANKDIYSNALNTYTQLQNSVQNVDSFGNLLTQNMGGINPNDVKYANQTLAQVRNQLSSPQQAQFDTTFAQLKARVATLLSAGGAQIPTQVTADANAIIDGSAPIGTLNATLQRIQAEGNILLNNQKDIVTKSYSNVTGGSGGSSTSGATGGVVQTTAGAIPTNW